MYNRYIPQSDGSYRRNTVNEQRPAPSPRQKQSPTPSIPANEPISSPRVQESPLQFLRNLLPGDFDTADLLIVLLLLLMSGDSSEMRGNAMLTLALYLFL